MPDPVHLTLLGTVDLRHPDGTEVRSVLAQPKRVALLAWLVVEGRGGPVTRDRVVAAFWPEASADRARSSLRTSLYQLRQSLGPDALTATGDSVRVEASALTCDAVQLLGAAEEGDHAGALRLHAGPFMPGFHLADAPAVEEWLEARRAEVHRAIVDAALQGAAADPSDPDVLRVLAAVVEEHPGEEEALLRFLEGVHRTRGAGAALEARARWSERYEAAFGLPPNDTSPALLSRLESGDAVRAAESTVPGPAGAAPPRTTTDDAHHRPATTPGSRRSPWAGRAPGFIAAGALVAVAAVLLRPATPVLEPGESLRVGSFEVDGPAAQAHLGRLAGFLLGRELDAGDDGPRVWPAGAGVPPEGCEGRVAGAVDARIVGEVTVAGEGVRVRACLRRGEQTVRSWEAEGTAAGIHEVVAALARDVRSDLELAAPVGTTPPPTSAPGAYPAFVEGERHRLAGRFRDALASFDRALALDSTFAWAHYRRSTSAEWLGLTGEAKASADHALAHSARTAPRERALLDAWRSYLWGDIEKARTELSALVHQRPTDPDVWGRLAELRFHWGSRLGIPNDSADAAFRRVLDLTPDHAPALMHHIRFAARTASPEELEALARRFAALDAPEEERIEVATLVALRTGDDGYLRETAAPWVAAHDSLLESARLGALLASTAEPAAVERLVELLPPPADETRAVARRILLVQTAVARGRPGLADARIEALGQEHPDRATEMAALLALVPTAPLDETGIRGVRDRLRAVPEPPVPLGGRVKYAAFEGIFPPRRLFLDAALSARLPEAPDSARYWSTLNASNDLFKADYIRLVEGAQWAWRREPERVLNALREGWLPVDRVLSDVLDHATAVERWMRIEALLAVDREEDALRWLRTFPDATGYDGAWLPAALVLEGEILERRGQGARAEDRFRRALHIWSDAEPAIEPWVARAREGLGRAGAAGGP